MMTERGSGFLQIQVSHWYLKKIGLNHAPKNMMLKRAKMLKENRKIILILSNKYDITTDYVCVELERRGRNYLRLNRDEFNRYRVLVNPLSRELSWSCGEETVTLDPTSLQAVYYRAPTFLRDNYQPDLSAEEQLYRSQWSAFVRDLDIFSEAIWMNNPVATYKAENKMLQLHQANEVGLLCPLTFISNYFPEDRLPSGLSDIIIKSLDTGLLRMQSQEAFVYTNIVSLEEARKANYMGAPVILQEHVTSKVDIRVTVVHNSVFAARILSSGEGIVGDWRKAKDYVQYQHFELPEDIASKCVLLVKKLGLSFGAIDLVETNNGFIFIEVNPTGEWAWLVDSAGQEIHKSICDYLDG